MAAKKLWWDTLNEACSEVLCRHRDCLEVLRNIDMNQIYELSEKEQEYYALASAAVVEPEVFCIRDEIDEFSIEEYHALSEAENWVSVTKNYLQPEWHFILEHVAIVGY